MVHYQILEENTLSWLDFPITIRKALEGTLVNIVNNEEASRSFFEIVPEAIDIKKTIGGLADDVLEVKNSSKIINIQEKTQIIEKLKKRDKYYGYHNLLDRNRHIKQLDLLCASHTLYRKAWEEVVRNLKIKTKKGEIMPCFIPGCQYREESLSIPLSKTFVYVSDEDLWSREDVIPELNIIFPEKRELYRLFFKTKTETSNYWFSINTCPEHKSREGARLYMKESHSNFGEDIEAFFSEKIIDEKILMNTKGITIDEKEYLLQ